LQKKLLPAPAGGDDDQIGVIERAIERIDQYRRLAGPIQTDQHAILHGKRWPDER